MARAARSVMPGNLLLKVQTFGFPRSRANIPSSDCRLGAVELVRPDRDRGTF
jgi:hypothetical protein